MTRKIKAYIYPNSAKIGDHAVNPYKSNFADSLRDWVDFVNLQSPTEYGIFDILKYYPSLQYIFLHWPEDLPDKKGGKAQAALLMSLMMLSKAFSKKTVYVMHNKRSHYDTNAWIKGKLMSFLCRHSDYVVTHASEGVRHLRSLGRKKSAFFFPHPITRTKAGKLNSSKRYDVLLWGTITPYKGIDLFLKSLYSHKLEDQFRMMIVGKIEDEKYEEKLASYRNDKIKIENRRVERSELNSLMDSSEHGLFTYLKESVLSSGALMDSLAAKCKIIGPDTGAFKDLRNRKIIETFEDYPKLFQILINGSAIWNQDWQERVEKFIRENTWNAFGKNLMRKIAESERGKRSARLERKPSVL